MRIASAASWIVIAVVTIAAVVGGGMVVRRYGGAAAKGLEPAGTLADDVAYLVYLPQIEVENVRADSRKWDSGGTAPDIRYEIHWRGTRVFESSVSKDALVARWDQDEIGLRDVMAGVSLERAAKGARISAKRGETLRFRVIDDDPAGDDDIGAWDVAVDALHVGDHSWVNPAPGVRQVVCRVTPADGRAR